MVQILFCFGTLPDYHSKRLISSRYIIDGQYRGTKVPRYRYCVTFLVPVPSVLLWYRYRGTLQFFGGTGTLVLFYFLAGILGS